MKIGNRFRINYTDRKGKLTTVDGDKARLSRWMDNKGLCPSCQLTIISSLHNTAYFKVVNKKTKEVIEILEFMV